MSSKSVRNLVLAGVFLALALLLPFLTGQIPSIGNRLLPMHLPVLLCGLLCGWQYGLIVGFVAPLLRSVLFGMPPIMPTAAAMAFELAAYGAVSGLMVGLLPRRKFSSVLAALLVSMLAGRIVWGLVSWALYAMMGNPFGFAIFWTGAFANAIIGVAVQLVLIPAIIVALWRVEDRITT